MYLEPALPFPIIDRFLCNILLSGCARWLVQLLRRSAFYLRVHIANETRSDEERKELTEHLTNQLDKLESDARRVTGELKADVYERSQKACDELISHLDMAPTRARLLLWQVRTVGKSTSHTSPSVSDSFLRNTDMI